jgi:hypothetical protein
LKWEQLKKSLEYDAHIGLIQQQHQRKINVKKQRSGPRHEPPHLGSPGAATMQLVSSLPQKMSSSKKTRKVNTKKSWTRSSGSTPARI